MTKEEFYIYSAQCGVNSAKNLSWRRGQVLFNTLYDFKPEIANEYRGTDLDPFYDDDKIEDFIAHLYVNHVDDQT